MSTQSDADRYANLELKMACPNCGSGGMIPWKQLDHVLICHGCDTRYKLSRTGLVELPPAVEDRVRLHVRTNSSAWREHLAVIVRAPDRQARLAEYGFALISQGRTRWIIAVALLILVGTGVAIAGRKPAAPPPLEIPDSLDGRATLFTEALARRDTDLMARLTDPAQHRVLRIWLAHGSDLPQPVQAADPAPQAEILSTGSLSAASDSVDVRARSTPSAESSVTVRVRLPAGAGHAEVVLDEQWAKRGQAWYFQPVRIRSPSPTGNGPPRPYVKTKRGR